MTQAEDAELNRRFMDFLAGLYEKHKDEMTEAMTIHLDMKDGSALQGTIRLNGSITLKVLSPQMRKN